MNEYKIILKALSTLAVNHSLETVTGIFSESELANAIKKLVLVKIIGLIVFIIISAIVIASLNQITDQIAHYIYHYNGGFCEYYR